MKKLIALLFVLCAATPAFAEESNLAGGEMTAHGGYGAFGSRMSTIHGERAFFLGGRGGWIINHRLVLGGAGYGLVNEIGRVTAPDGTERHLGMGYGGPMLGLILASDRLIHLTLDVVVGAGGAAWERFDDDGDDWEDQLDDDDEDDYGSAFFVVEPSINLELNVAPFLRVSAGVGYRYVKGLDMPCVKEDDLRGRTFGVALKFGHF